MGRRAYQLRILADLEQKLKSLKDATVESFENSSSLDRRNVLHFRNFAQTLIATRAFPDV